ncbi:MAG: cation transporter [Eubacteriales bacterium]|jgi:copper chaperone CopZ|nr:cation transporter [Eubacteriales bacterium]
MKKTVRLEGLGCASCAAKIENAVAKLNGVSAASVNFVTTKMVIEGEDARMDEILTQASAIVKKVEPDVVVRKA